MTESISQSSQEQEKISALKDEVKNEFRKLFYNREELTSRINKFIPQFETFRQGGLIFDEEAVIKGLQESLEIKDCEEFIGHFLRVLDPLIILKVTKPEIFERVRREAVFKDNDCLKLSEVLYANLNKEYREVEIHVPPAAELIREKGIGFFRQEGVKGLAKLAKIMESYPDIDEVHAVSWIVAKNPLLLKKLGFTVEGELSEQERENYMGEKRPIARAFMTREQLLARYGRK